MEKRGGAPIPGALPWAVELRPAPSTLSMLPRIGNSSPMAAPRGSREDDVELSEPRVSANFASEGRLRSQGLEDTLVVATMRGSNPDKEVVTTPLEVPPASHPGNNPASVVVGDRPRRTPPGLDGSQLSHLQTEDHSHDKESSDLHVTMKEQALIRANIEAVEAADDEVEVFDENAESAPSNFYRYASRQPSRHTRAKWRTQRHSFPRSSSTRIKKLVCTFEGTLVSRDWRPRPSRMDRMASAVYAADQ